MLHQPNRSLVRKTSAAHVSLSSIFDCQRTERKPSQPKHQNKQVPAPLRVKTRKPSVSGDGDSERRRCFPAPPSLLMGLYAPPPRTVKPPPQKKSNQPKKLTQPTHHPWGKPTQQHNKTKQNQHSNNMHRQTKGQESCAVGSPIQPPETGADRGNEGLFQCRPRFRAPSARPVLSRGAVRKAVSGYSVPASRLGTGPLPLDPPLADPFPLTRDRCAGRDRLARWRLRRRANRQTPAGTTDAHRSCPRPRLAPPADRMRRTIWARISSRMRAHTRGTPCDIRALSGHPSAIVAGHVTNTPDCSCPSGFL